MLEPQKEGETKHSYPPPYPPPAELLPPPHKSSFCVSRSSTAFGSECGGAVCPRHLPCCPPSLASSSSFVSANFLPSLPGSNQPRTSSILVLCPNANGRHFFLDRHNARIPVVFPIFPNFSRIFRRSPPRNPPKRPKTLEIPPDSLPAYLFPVEVCCSTLFLF